MLSKAKHPCGQKRPGVRGILPFVFAQGRIAWIAINTQSNSAIGSCGANSFLADKLTSLADPFGTLL
jgi:hypothetical protein